MKKIIVIFTIIIVIGAISFVWWKNGTAEVNAQDQNKKIFVIKKGEQIRNIANELKKEGLIRDPVVFFLVVKIQGVDKDIQAGSYNLSPSMNTKALLNELRHGTVDFWVTIPEGFRADEIADILEESFVAYDDSWREALNNEEGYLFPDTYLMPRDADIDLIISIFKDNFYLKIEDLGLTLDSLGIKSLVVKASLIEREALFEGDHSLIASVINNRLNIGMPLQIDATLQYVAGYSEKDNTWWRVPTQNDKEIKSPYNTYINTGLPPGPISNPGILALRAALDSQDTNYIYYIHDKNGGIRLAETLDEHNENVNKYLR